MKHHAVILLSMASAVFLAACGSEEESQGRGPWGGGATRVVTAEVELQPLVDEIQALGTARANESIQIQPRISSLIEEINFEEGQRVAAGELLVELENSEILAGLALAEANLSESRSLYERNLSLSSSQAISVSNLEELLAEVQVNQAQVQAAQARLDNTLIRAPFDGRVGLRRVSPGSFVSSSTIITTLDDISIIKLDFSVPETFLTVVSEGMDIRAESVVYPDRVFEGTVISVDTRLDPVSRSVQVRAAIPNDDEALKPGMFMTVDLQRDRGEVLVAPEQAIGAIDRLVERINQANTMLELNVENATPMAEASAQILDIYRRMLLTAEEFTQARTRADFAVSRAEQAGIDLNQAIGTAIAIAETGGWRNLR